MNPEILREANALAKMGEVDLASRMLRYAALNDLYDELALMGDGAYEVAADIRRQAAS